MFLQKVRRSAAECLEQLYVLSEKYHSALSGGNDVTVLFSSYDLVLWCFMYSMWLVFSREDSLILSGCFVLLFKCYQAAVFIDCNSLFTEAKSEAKISRAEVLHPDTFQKVLKALVEAKTACTSNEQYVSKVLDNLLNDEESETSSSTKASR